MSATGGPPKQLRSLGGAPVIVQTLRTLARHPAIDAIVVVGPPAGEERLQSALQEYDLSKVVAVVAGGSTRQESVGNGLVAAPAGTEIVLVHDGVRPFLRGVHIRAIVDAAREHGAAALAIPVVDTLRKSDGDVFGTTVPRDRVWRMQTPQAARLALLKEAHTKSAGVVATDEVALLEMMGARAAIVEGATDNIKITTPSDWELAEAIWPSWEARELPREG